MGKYSYYKEAFSFASEFKEKDLVSDRSLWSSLRGFFVNPPLTWEGNLVFCLYDLSGNFKTYQIRKTGAEQEDPNRYELTKPTQEPLLKTDNLDLLGTFIIVEGTPDCALLRKYGINAHTFLGLKGSRIYKALDFLKQEENFIYILDNDWHGDIAYRYIFSKSSGIRLNIPLQYKDINDYYNANIQDFEAWVQETKKLLNVLGNHSLLSESNQIVH